MPEIWDVYDENRCLTGQTAVRGGSMPVGGYHLVVDALFLNDRGEILLQQRADCKDILPGCWSASTGGSAIQGEDSRAAMTREVSEELGFRPDWDHSRLYFTETRSEGTGYPYHRDVFLFRQNIAIDEMSFQAEEVQSARWILPEDILADASLLKQVSNISFWEKVFPYLYLESMRVRIPKGLYRHCKGNFYRVLGLALHSETVAPMVIYQAQYGLMETWVRPAEMWNETVVKNGVAQPRFTLIQKEEDIT